jgi:hypothetical protein
MAAIILRTGHSDCPEHDGLPVGLLIGVHHRAKDSPGFPFKCLSVSFNRVNNSVERFAGEEAAKVVCEEPDRGVEEAWRRP